MAEKRTRKQAASRGARATGAAKAASPKPRKKATKAAKPAAGKDAGSKKELSAAELQQQALQPIDGKNIVFGTVTEKEMEQKFLTSLQSRQYYIEPLNGTSIKNSTGTLTIRVVQLDGSGATLLSAGPIKMFKPDGTLAGNGYT